MYNYIYNYVHTCDVVCTYGIYMHLLAAGIDLVLLVALVASMGCKETWHIQLEIVQALRELWFLEFPKGPWELCKNVQDIDLYIDLDMDIDT